MVFYIYILELSKKGFYGVLLVEPPITLLVMLKKQVINLQLFELMN